MFKGFKGFLVGFIVATLNTSGITVMASVGAKTLTAYFNNIRLVVDGELIIPKDSTGKEVEPFIVDGTTYLPVRAISDALGKEVSWDDGTKTVYLGKVPGKTSYMFDVLTAYEVKCTEPNGRYKEKETVKILGDSYANSATFSYSSGNSLIMQTADLTASYNLNGQYKTIRGFIGFADGSRDFSGIFKVELDGKLYKEYQVKTDELPKEVAIDVTGVQVMKITAPCMYGDNTTFGFGSVTIE